MSNIPYLNHQEYERYLPTAFDESMTLLEKVNKVLKFLNDVITVTNGNSEQVNGLKAEFEALKEWIENEGLTDRLTTILDDWYINGKLADIINNDVFSMKADKNRLQDLGVNVRDYGAKGDGLTDDSDAIIQAITQNPNRKIVLANGVFCTTQPININNDCSLYLIDAELKATALMDYLINFETTRSITSAFSLSRDCFIIGEQGTLNGNNLVNKVLRLNKFLHFTLRGINIYNARKRGLTINDSGSMSAELVASDLYFANDTDEYYTDSIAIENLGGDSFFTDINIVDFTVGVKDTRNCTWTRVHPWISHKRRIPNSKSFWLNGNNFTLLECVVDSTQYGVYLEYGTARIKLMKSYWNAGVYSDVDATLYPVVMFKNVGSGLFYVDSCIVNAGDLTVPIKVVDDYTSPNGYYSDIHTFGEVQQIPKNRFPFVNHNGLFTDVPKANGYEIMNGNTNSKGFVFAGSNVVGVSNASNGKQLRLEDGGNLMYGSEQIDPVRGTFTPTLVGSTVAGTHTYGQQVGKYTKRGNVVDFTVSMIVTVDSTTDGVLKIKGLPFNVGDRSHALNIGYNQGFGSPLLAYTGVNNDEIILAFSTGGFAYTSAVSLRGVQLTITVSGTYLTA